MDDNNKDKELAKVDILAEHINMILKGFGEEHQMMALSRVIGQKIAIVFHPQSKELQKKFIEVLMYNIMVERDIALGIETTQEEPK